MAHVHGMTPGAKMAAPWGPKFISTFRGHIDLHHLVREKNVSYFNIDHFSCQIWPIFQFLVRAIHGLAPGAKMAAPWGPKFISTFMGHIALHHHIREKNVSYFNIGHLSRQIWPIFQFLLRGSCSMDHDAYAYISEHPPDGLNHQCFGWFYRSYVRTFIFGHGKVGINSQSYPISPIGIKCI